mgnify:CR=1 FL=1
MPEDVAQLHLDAGDLVRVLADWAPPLPGDYLCYPSRRQQSPAFVLLMHEDERQPLHAPQAWPRFNSRPASANSIALSPRGVDGRRTDQSTRDVTGVSWVQPFRHFQ